MPLLAAIIGGTLGVVAAAAGIIGAVITSIVRENSLLERLGLAGKPVRWLKHKRYLVSLHEDEVLNEKKSIREGRELLPENLFRKVAVKIIRKSDRADAELAILKTHKHKNIVEYIDFEEIEVDGLGPHLYIIMERCEYSLRRYMKDWEQMAMPIEIFHSISAQLLAGLGYIHAKGLIHGDINPDNILVTKDIEFKFHKFGIAKEFPHATDTNRDTGSDGYRPRESYISGVELKKAADIFSLGIILTQIISRGKHPFGADPDDWSYHIRKDKNLDFSHVDFPTPERDILIPLLTKMLSWNPDNRPSIDYIQEHELFNATCEYTGESICRNRYFREHGEYSTGRESHVKWD